MSAIERLGQEQFSESDPGMEYLSLDEAAPMLEALSSDTAQSILAEVCRDPSTATDIADRAGTSIQNVGHHLTQLEDAGLVAVVGTRYSEKGRKMKVYARGVDGFAVGWNSAPDEPDADAST